MKSILFCIALVTLLISNVNGQNRIVFSMGNYLDCKIRMVNNDNLKVSTQDEFGKSYNHDIGFADIVKIFGPISKSQTALIKNRNSAIVFDESEVNSISKLNDGAENPLTVQLSSIKNIVPLEDAQSFYNDGELYQFYIKDNVRITMNIFTEFNYGRYYVALIAIENLSGEKFELDPANIKAIYTVPGGTKTAKVLSNKEYMAIVDRSQSINSFLVAFGETSSANKAGYSTSITNANIQGTVNTTRDYTGQINNTSVSYQGTTNSSGNINVTSNTQSFDGAAKYAANQNARRNIQSFNNQQFQIRENLNSGYLKRNTIFNEQNVFGCINIIHEKTKQLVVLVPVRDDYFCFVWDFEKDM